ncbi:hypothetical protein [Algoriphagus terrigena]|uniref:hypothetical protein n=1 Tax=Algoriphagus terrigena TaxID=344884 RepID=UPI0003F5D117|nr:hypothetical protein [Algoriphagus terrigena]
MKNVSLSSIAKILLLFFLSLQYFDATAQNESVIFNLTEGKFNIEKIPYVHAITITGIPTKDGENVDAIRLVVNKVTSDEEKDLLVKKEQARKLSEDLVAIKAQLDFLSNEVLPKIAANNITILKDGLTKNKLSDLAMKFEQAGTIPSDLELDELRKATNDEIEKQNASHEEIENKNILLKAEIVELEKTVSALPFFDGMWIRTSDADVDFSFTLPAKLKMGESYQFAFSIYKQNKLAAPIDELLNPLISEFNQRLDSLGYYEVDEIDQRVAETIKKIETDFFANVYSLDPTNKSLAPKKGFGLDEQTIMILSSLIRKYYIEKSNLEENATTAKARRNDIAEIVDSRSITDAHYNEILRLIELPEKSLELRNALIQAGYTTAENDLIVTHYKTLTSVKGRDITITTTNIKTYEDIEEIFTKIKNLYTQVGNVTYKVSTGDTDIDGIMVSTTYGIGIVHLDKNTIEWVRFFGINIRFDGFDNRLPNKEAYHSYWSRISLMVGISTTSDMQYKGNQLENTRLGLKPVIGLNWEPFKHINIGAGMISFIQESTADSQKDPKIRPYVSLSFDFNLFNYLIQKQ